MRGGSTAPIPAPGGSGLAPSLTEELLGQHEEVLLAQAPLSHALELPAQHLGQPAPGCWGRRGEKLLLLWETG